MSGAASKPRIYEFRVQSLHSLRSCLHGIAAKGGKNEEWDSVSYPNSDIFAFLPLAVSHL